MGVVCLSCVLLTLSIILSHRRASFVLTFSAKSVPSGGYQQAGMDDSKHGGQTYPEMLKGNQQA